MFKKLERKRKYERSKNYNKSTKERQKIAMQLKATVAAGGISNAIAKIPLMQKRQLRTYQDNVGYPVRMERKMERKI